MTPRTAGFNTLPMAEFTNATLLMIIIAMLIGGNSCSSAGSMKVSTISVLVLNTIARFRGKQSATLFGRCISSKTVSQAGIVLLAYVSFAAVGLILVSISRKARCLTRIPAESFRMLSLKCFRLWPSLA